MAKLLMRDGTEVEIRLTFKDLYNLEKTNSKLAEEYFNVQKKDELNELDMLKVLRAGYICSGNGELSFDEFLDKVSQNRNNTLSAYYEMLYPKN